MKRLFLLLVVFGMLNFFSLTEVQAYTNDDVELLANIMWLENGHTGKTTKENEQVLLYTGSVVVNRANSGEWGGTTIHDVLYAKGQYASSTKNRLFKEDIPEKVYVMAEFLLCYGPVCPKEVIYQSMQPNLGKRWKVIAGEYFATTNGKTTSDWKVRLFARLVIIPLPERIKRYVEENNYFDNESLCRYFRYGRVLPGRKSGKHS